MPTKKEILKAKIRAFKTTLQNATPKQKEGRLSIQLAKNFNGLIVEVGENFSDIKEDMPEEITWTGHFARLDSSDVTYLDVEILADQILALLDLLDD